MKPITLLFLLSGWLFYRCAEPTSNNEELFKQASVNGLVAKEGYARSLHFVKGWMDKRDSVSGLIPENLTRGIDTWNAHNSAADNYAFMVLTAFMTDKNLYNTVMADMLKAERALTSRIDGMPDDYSFSKQGFLRDSADMARIIFGTSEYIKDGLIPLLEYIGPSSPWQGRMVEMLNGLFKHYTVLTRLHEGFRNKAAVEEVNGEMLQTLCRMYWTTGEQKYLERALIIGDHYLNGAHNPADLEVLRIRDHGCEIIGGLSELYVTLHFVDPGKKKSYQKELYRLLDRVLEKGRKEDGMFYNAINPVTGEVVDENVVDNFGYVYNAYYSVYLIDGKQEYKDAVIHAMKPLYKNYRNFRWEGDSHDGYADAIESAINLYNRIPDDTLMMWIDSEMQVMFGMQKEDGIIGGWHGDGNFARTTLMYCLMKSQGTTLQPWNDQVILGAVLDQNDSTLFITVESGTEWEGKLEFDIARHKEVMHLPIDYPRINQFPEWFVAKKERMYTLTEFNSEGSFSKDVSGEELRQGIDLKLAKGEVKKIKIALD
ncbi:MAG: hypothetical protein OEY51_03850 [Cyclobacteriaceae bacterium]|nr:hypothetical protein [Cyclobacteriaceae bacterium]